MTVGVLIIATDNVRVSGRSKKTRNEVFECRSRDFITIRVGPKEKIKKTVDELSFYFLFLENTKRYRFIYLFFFFDRTISTENTKKSSTESAKCTAKNHMSSPIGSANGLTSVFAR